MRRAALPVAALVLGAMILPGATGNHIPEPPNVLGTATLAGNSYWGAKFTTVGTSSSIQLEMVLKQGCWPIHDGFGLWLMWGTIPIVAVGAAVIEGETRFFVDYDLGVVSNQITLAEEDRFGGTIVTATIQIHGLWESTWRVIASAASPDCTTEVKYELRSENSAALASTTSGLTGFFYIDRDFAGTFHAQYSEVWLNLLVSRAEAAVQVTKSVPVTNRMFAFYMLHGQVNSGSITGAASASGGDCYSVYNGPPGTWNFNAALFAGVTPAYGIVGVGGLTCFPIQRVGPILVSTNQASSLINPEAILVVGADATMPP